MTRAGPSRASTCGASGRTEPRGPERCDCHHPRRGRSSCPLSWSWRRRNALATMERVLGKEWLMELSVSDRDARYAVAFVVVLLAGCETAARAVTTTLRPASIR